MHDGRCLRGKIERGAGPYDEIKRQPVSGIEPAGRRLKIKRRQIRPFAVELECTRHMKGIPDMLVAQHGSSAGEFGNQQNLRLAAGLKP